MKALILLLMIPFVKRILNIRLPSPRLLTTSSKPLLLRDYIQSRLYNEKSGYFAQHVLIGGQDNTGLKDPIDFNRLYDEVDFKLTLKNCYKQGEALVKFEIGKSAGSGAWMTPCEVFRPWYGYAIADLIVKKASMDGKMEPPSLEIFEIGSGSGTCMIDVLSRIQEKYPELFKRTKYTCVEISKRLAEAQKRRAESLELDPRHWNVICTNFLALKNHLSNPKETAFVLAFEVLDNLPHDKVLYDREANPWEAVLVEMEQLPSKIYKAPTEIKDFIMSFTSEERKTLRSETHFEVYRLCQDAKILEMLNLLRECEERHTNKPSHRGFAHRLQEIVGIGTLRYSKTGVLTQGSAVHSRQGIIYVPTGQLQFLKAIQRCFPKHCLILSDFDALPGKVLPGAGGPAVQSIGKRNSIGERSTYLLPDDIPADIFFPTDFLALQYVYEKLFNIKSEVKSASLFFAPFKESITKCTTMSGYCPLTQYYANTSYLESEYSSS